ncbi:hypothetical protein HWV62_35967 [Athelia sp. TMB]|nr:hypothetical protein HWV62_35967 [Athelia sp. TMB]
MNHVHEPQASQPPAKKKKKGKGKLDPDAPVPEKRGAIFKKACPKNIMERVDRVMSQRFFMVDRTRVGQELREEFKVLGSTGNVYTVVIDKNPSCNCTPLMSMRSYSQLKYSEALMHRKETIANTFCSSTLKFYKSRLHLGFGIKTSRALLTSELQTIFDNAPLAPNSVAHPQVRDAYARATGKVSATSSKQANNAERRVPGLGDECPICYEGMHELDQKKLTWCADCGNALHNECFSQCELHDVPATERKTDPRWKLKGAKQNPRSITCVYCRAKWKAPVAENAASARPGRSVEGYMNLANLAGIDEMRDTSTYYQGPRRGERHRLRLIIILLMGLDSDILSDHVVGGTRLFQNLLLCLDSESNVARRPPTRPRTTTHAADAPMANMLTLYEPMDVIGNGSFGIIRKARRKSDGLRKQIFARKELNFERMSERDRKQIVAEVNILKDLHHEHIVRYHDRYVDRDAGILYIMMEYCGGGDLSTVIKQAQKHNRPIPEDTIWLYFMQILQALCHCHHPNSHMRPGATGVEGEGSKRAQILHRDLKPDNVFLDENNTVKLGDFGLSKQLAQASFANTYVGTPYYMSPELMQEKAYDSKSDIWSLGCLIYELCALKPPFHEAKTHAELSVFIRPSASQLLQHERLDLVLKVSETEKMLATVKAHKTTVLVKEREVAAREATLLQNESLVQSMQTVIAQKDEEIATLRAHLPKEVETQVKKRMEEVKVQVLQYQREMELAAENRERELQEAVMTWEAQYLESARVREESYRREMQAHVEEQMKLVKQKEIELEEGGRRLNGLKEELDGKLKAMKEGAKHWWSHILIGVAGLMQWHAGRKDKAPLEEVQNLLEPLARITDVHHRTESIPEFRLPVETPSRGLTFPGDYPLSAMKGVVLTATGEPLATPMPNLFAKSPKVALSFAKIFDFEENEEGARDGGESDTDTEGPPPSPSMRKIDTAVYQRESNSSSNSSSSSGSSTATVTVAAPATRLRRPSIRRSLQRTGHPSTSEAVTGTKPASKRVSSSSLVATAATVAAPTIKRSATMPMLASPPLPEYDFNDEENLPSPFLKRTEKENPMLNGGATGTVRAKAPGSKRPSGGNMLRAVAAVNAANAAAAGGAKSKAGLTRPSVTSARKASEEARKALLRP